MGKHSLVCDRCGCCWSGDPKLDEFEWWTPKRRGGFCGDRGTCTGMLWHEDDPRVDNADALRALNRGRGSLPRGEPKKNPLLDPLAPEHHERLSVLHAQAAVLLRQAKGREGRAIRGVAAMLRPPMIAGCAQR